MSEIIHLEYSSQKYVCTADIYSSNTLLARLQMNIWICLVSKIPIYRRVLGIYIPWDLQSAGTRKGLSYMKFLFVRIKSSEYDLPKLWFTKWSVSCSLVTLNFFSCSIVHPPATTWSASHICHIKAVPASSVFAFSYITTDLLIVLWYWTWRCLHLIGHHHFLLHFSSSVILNYFLTMLPSLHHVWSKVEAQFCRALNMVHETPFSRQQKKTLLLFS